MSETTPEARLLVVEDEPNILELLSASLRLAGFEVVTATGGLEAIQAVQRHRPDLVVLDVMLPDLDGFDVARRLRSGGTRTPVLFLTARDATEDKVGGLSIGGDDYVTKPFSLEEVIARIRAGSPVEVQVGEAAVDGRPGAAVEVVDHGPGLTPDQAERVFERFYRADPARSGADGGTGLGLSIVAALVAVHGGTVQVDSVPGRGARFRVVLPLAPDAAS